MNENINLFELLKDCPINTEFYSPMIGDCKLSNVNSHDVVVGNLKGALHINHDGTAIIWGYNTTELMLFPSETQRDWSKWKYPKPKFDPKTLQPFDKVLVRIKNEKHYVWCADFISRPLPIYEKTPCVMNIVGGLVIPYNEETKHLVGTTDEAPDFYKYWED